MKKLETYLLVLSLSVMALACRHRGHTIIRSSDGQNTTQIEYSGKMVFNNDNSIGYMSPKSYLRYQHNNNKLEVTCDRDGKISYETNDGSTAKLEGDSKELLTEAVKEILKARQKPAHR